MTAIGPRVSGANAARRASSCARSSCGPAILIGRVFEDGCDLPAEERTGCPRTDLLEDGTNVITDTNGRWHIEVEPGTHVAA